MKRNKILAVFAVCSLAAVPAMAGLNPLSPGLPTVLAASSPFASDMSNNQMSAMCVDCHTLAPKGNDSGTHFVSVGDGTNSGGSGINAAGTHGAARTTGEFFKVTAWNASGSTGAATYSKYGNAGISYVPAILNGSGTATEQATTAAFQGYEIICESCHNIITNDVGGNNLLENQAVFNSKANDWQDNDESSICVGCHGFMYSSESVPDTANGTENANANDARNDSALTGHTSGRRGNNEYHWVQSVAKPQNHHVMTGDAINSVMATATALWTDNSIVHYTDDPISNLSTKGTFPQRSSWGGNIQKPSDGGLICTSCHAPAHSSDTGAGAVDYAAGKGASMLRNATYVPARTNAWDRISDAPVGWKKIDDANYCQQCHEVP